MIEIIRLSEEPSADAIESMRGRAVYHSDILHRSHAALRLAGLVPLPLQSEIPDGAVLVLPADPPRGGPLYDAVQIMDRLLGPGGCPWDQAQTHQSLKRCLLEEAYEVFDAIDSGDDDKFIEELGDLLLQPIMHSQMAHRDGRFDADTVARRLIDKLVRRHPHVFGEVVAEDEAAVLRNWEKIKRTEKGGAPRSVLAGVPNGMASLLRAFEVSKRAARNGFEWPDIASVWAKLGEEEEELREALTGGDCEAVESEVGDLLFTVVNIARWAGVEPEEALRKMVDRFSRRFMAMERNANGRTLTDLSPKEWDDLWEAAKAEDQPTLDT